MLSKYVRLLLAADPAITSTGGSNGAGQATDPTAALVNLLAKQSSAPAGESSDEATTSEDDVPEEPPAPVQEDEPGQETLSPETEPNAEGDEPNAESDKPNEDPEQGAENADKGLPAAVQKRIDKLTAQKYQAQEALEEAKAEADRLREEVERLRVESPASSGEGQMPEPIAKLKTLPEVQRQLEAVTTELEAVQDFLDANPGDAETVYKIGAKEMTRKELIEMRSQLRQQARLLPQRGQQIAGQAQFQQARQQQELAIRKEFPVLADAEHPVTKVVSQLVKLPDFASKTNGLELAYIMARGNEVVTAERNKRKAGTAAAAPLVRKPQGKIPLGKPHVNGGGGGGRVASTITPKAALEALGKDGSTSSFAALLASSGAGRKS